MAVSSTSLSNLLSQRVLVLDGAMGTMIQRYHLTEEDFRGEVFRDWPIRLAGNNDIIALTRPDVLADIHRQYLEAGADIIETNTFNAQRISQTDYHTEDYVVQINRAAARIARAEANRMTTITPDRPRFVAASIGPTNKTLSMSPDVENPAYRAITFDELRDAYAEQMRPLVEEGVDLFLIETIFDTLNAKAALAAATIVGDELGHHLPVMLSATIADASGRTLSGQTLEAFVTSVAHHPDVLSVGLNCSFGADDMRPYLQQLSAIAPFFTSAHPNAGLPDEEGHYTESPTSMAVAIGHFLDDLSVNIVGGCCGSTPEHIAAINALVASCPNAVRYRSNKGKLPWLAGLDAFSPLQGTFMNVGERCNVAGSRKFLRLIKEKQYDEALSIARKQVTDGAMLIDVNMDDGLIDTEAEMTHFLCLMSSDPDIARLPWMIDSSRFSVIESALKCIQGKCVVNSISLKEGEAVFLERARIIHRYGAAMVVMAFDEEGQATTYERKVDVCSRAYKLLTEQVGILPTDIIFDPNILTVATGMPEHDRYALDFIRATDYIHKNLPGAHISGGVSNLSFAFRGNNNLREAMHAVFLFHAIAHGMDMGIVNPATKVMYHDLPANLLQALEDVILCRTNNAAEQLIALAQKMLAEKDTIGVNNSANDNQPTVDRTTISIEERLLKALQHGDDEFLEPDLTEALNNYKSPAAIIEGPLMAGMQHVGKLFGEGKMFLPQVVKSARTMKRAVAFLQPYIEKSQQDEGRGSCAGRYLVATVKGDVHDIGKNIVAVVLRCNNFEVTDLGVMVPAEQIVNTILSDDIQFAALSGLITPSLDEMCHTAAAMQKAGIRIPLFIGGATTSELHTALKIAPLYDGPVFHVKDASQNPVLALRLLSADGPKLIHQNREHQLQLVREHEQQKLASVEKPINIKSENTESVSGDLPEKEDRRLHIDWEHAELPIPSYTGCRTLDKISIAEIRPFINWIYFYHLWRVRPSSPEADNVRGEAEALLNKLEVEAYTMRGQVAFYPANGTEQGIHIKRNENKGKCSCCRTDDVQFISTPRQKHGTRQDAPLLALSDFIAPEPYTDYLGLFAVTIGKKLQSRLETLKATEGASDYNAILLQSVCDRLAEATAEWLHREVRRTLWGYAPHENLSFDELRRAAYRGIRPAVGYPSLPDQSQIFSLAKVLNLEEIGIHLTENGAMYPQSSVCGLLFSHPQAQYFIVEK